MANAIFKYFQVIYDLDHSIIAIGMLTYTWLFIFGDIIIV